MIKSELVDFFSSESRMLFKTSSSEEISSEGVNFISSCFRDGIDWSFSNIEMLRKALLPTCDVRKNDSSYKITNGFVHKNTHVLWRTGLA